MKTITVDKVMSWGPCYDRPWVKEKFKGRKRMTAEALVELGLDFDDTIWVLAHMMPKKKARQFAQDMAARAIKRRGVFSKNDRREALKLLKRADALINSRLDSKAMLELNEDVYKAATVNTNPAASQALWALDDATDDDNEANNAWSAASHVVCNAAYLKGPRHVASHILARQEERKLVLKKALEYL